MAIYQLDVDVAERRPPAPVNTVTLNTTVHVDDRASMSSMDAEARVTAALMAQVWGVMAIDARIVRAEL